MSREKSTKIRDSRGKGIADLTPKSAFGKRLQHAIVARQGEKNPRIKPTAEDIGIGVATLRDAITRDEGGYPGGRTIRKLASYLGCSTEYLLHGATEHASDQHTWSVPVVGRAAADDSAGRLTVFDHREGFVTDEDSPFGIAALIIHPSTAAIEVQGSSMEPLARRGQHIFIDQGERRVTNGDLTVLETDDGETFFKRYYEDNGHAILVSVNPTDPPDPIMIPKKKIAHKHLVVGVWFG